MINAKIVAHSKNDKGDELISFELTFPRIILPEILTHRMFSRNTSSSRAIPLKKMIEVVQTNPFIPIAWQKDHKGMQGTEYHDNIKSNELLDDWLEARYNATNLANKLYKKETTKQLCNRLLEPFMWTKMLLTTSKEGLMNFFDLRCPKYHWNDNIFYSKKECYKEGDIIISPAYEGNDYYEEVETLPKYLDDFFEWEELNESQAEIHIQALAELMYDTYNESNPQLLKDGQWHIPYGNKIFDKEVESYVNKNVIVPFGFEDVEVLHTKIKVATAMCARVSYTTIDDEKELDIDKMVKLHDKLIELKHDSPLEHCARCLTDEEYYLYSKGKDGSDEHQHGWVDNFKGFQSYRNLIKNNKTL